MVLLYDLKTITNDTMQQVVCSDWVQEAELMSTLSLSDEHLHPSKWHRYIERYQTGLMPDHERYIEQQLITDFDLKAHDLLEREQEARLCKLMI